MMDSRLVAVFALVSLGWTGCDDYRVCDEVPAERLQQLPTRLSETGLFEDIATERLSASVRPYSPQFELWSDGARKRRWVFLPEDGRIDTSDPDFWRFPVGTRFWKEFTRDGVRVETRLLQKVGAGPQDWGSVSYLWNDDQTDAIATPEGLENAGGTLHDVPKASNCMGCHGGTPSRILGFSAVQLSWDAPPDALDLDDLIRAGALTEPPSEPLVLPGNDLDRRALGYLHANCSHCHNQGRPASDGSRCFDPQNSLEFLLRVDSLDSVTDTPAYKTGVDEGEIHPGRPDGSPMVHRLEGQQMPPLGTEVVDDEAVETLRQWISGL